jgi:hypothetical protein
VWLYGVNFTFKCFTHHHSFRILGHGPQYFQNEGFWEAAAKWTLHFFQYTIAVSSFLFLSDTANCICINFFGLCHDRPLTSPSSLFCSWCIIRWWWDRNTRYLWLTLTGERGWHNTPAAKGSLIFLTGKEQEHDPLSYPAAWGCRSLA